jgi:alpha-glucosidase
VIGWRVDGAEQPKDAVEMADWWRGAVLYQIYPRSFCDSDGDGVGDLRGIAEKLDYVASLGVDGIWISPVARSPMKDFGYDVADYCDIDPLFGSLDDFDAMLARAHALGLKIILDLVISHTSDQHPWFKESRADRANRRADWYVWADARPGGAPPNNWLSVFGGSAWTWDEARSQFYLHNFLAEQPDLNFHEPAVQDALLEAAAFWLDRGVDGFRLDTANFYFHDAQLRDNPLRPADAAKVQDPWFDNPYFGQVHLYDKSRPDNIAFLRRLRALMDRYPDRMAVGEIADDDPLARMAEYVQPGLLHTAYTFNLLGPYFSAAHIRTTLVHFMAVAGEGWPSWAFSNHDVERAVSRLGGEGRPAFAPMLVALLTSLRGTAYLYQGEELGLPEAHIPRERLRDPYGIAFWPTFKGRDGCRTPMPWQAGAPHAGFSTAEPWLPVPQAHRDAAVDTQTRDPHSTLETVRALLAWRRRHPALRDGGIRFLDTPEPVLMFERYSDTETLLCVFNLGADPQIVASLGMGLEDMTPVPLGSERRGDALRLGGYGAYFGRRP